MSTKHETMSGIVASLMLLVCCSTSMRAQYLFDTTPELNRYLWYHQIVNTFDSAVVTYEVGEFTLHRSNGHERIFNRISRSDFASGSEGKARAGSSGRGTDPVLSALAQTRPFLLPLQPSSMSFARVLQASTCDDVASQPTGGSGSDGRFTPRDQQYLAGRGRILDTSEFVLEVVDASTGEVYGTIDSVGLIPNTIADVVQRYGTEPDASTRALVAVPTRAAGKTVFIRVSVRRWGPSPHGMALRRVHHGISLSAQHAYMPNDASRDLPSWCDPAHGERLDSLYHEAVVGSIVAHRDSTGCLLVLPHGANTRDARQEVLVSVINSIRQSAAQLPNCTDASRVAWNWYLSTLDEDPASMTKPRLDAAYRTTSPLSMLVTRARGDGATQCVVESSTAAPATYELWSLAGQRVCAGTLQLSEGRATYTLDTPALASGAYLAILRRDDNIAVQQGFVIHQ